MMPFYAWIGIAIIGTLCAIRFWPVTAIDIAADHGKKPNYYQSSEHEGLFDVPASTLEAAFMAWISKQPRMKEVSTNRTGFFRATYVQRSLVFGFPDIISVQIKTVTPTSASIALMSKSKFGYSDFGVNRKRVKTLLAGLRQQLGT